jgi:hypothetical protein
MRSISPCLTSGEEKENNMDDFNLPFTAIFTCAKDEKNNKFIAHALDFDLVCTGPTREAALDRLRQTTKTYIEFGYSQGWAEHIKFPAPPAFWDEAWKEGNQMKPLPPIMIDTKKIFILGVKENETLIAA